jgi:hypothetical protein
MTDLSLVTQKVQAAFLKDVQNIEDIDEFNLAEAILELADQVVPENLHQCETYTNEAIRLNMQGVRHKLLVIADKLKAL